MRAVNRVGALDSECRDQKAADAGEQLYRDPASLSAIYTAGREPTTRPCGIDCRVER